MDTPNIVLVGVGRFGINHLRVLNELDKKGQCNLYGVVDVNSNRLGEIEEDYEVQTSTELDDFLTEDVDAFDIVSPTHTHFSISKKCLEAGKHVMVEKPLTTCYYEAKELVKLASEKKMVLMTGHIFRYNKAVWEIRNILERGELGDISYILGHFMGFSNPRDDTGVILNLIIHHIDLYNHLFGMLPKRLSCTTGYYLGRMEFEDYALISLEYPPNILGVIEGSWMTPGKRRDLTIIGNKKSITCDLLEQSIEIHDIFMEKKDGRFKAVNRGITRVQLDFEEPLKLELADFIHSMKTGNAPLANGKSALEAILVAEMASKSARLKREVILNEI